jgi:hypothetical protein
MTEATGPMFHGELVSADASAGAAMTLYGESSATSITLDTNDVLAVTNVTIVCGAALTVTVFDGANQALGAGETICAGDFAANGGINAAYDPPHKCQKGTGINVLASGAGAVKVQVKGWVKRKGA